MRTTVFIAICSFISAAIVFVIELGLSFFGIYIPYFDWIVFDVLKIALILPVVIFLLKPLNDSIKLWRLEKGRNIDAEELYETKTGLISISEKEDNVSRLLEK